MDHPGSGRSRLLSITGEAQNLHLFGRHASATGHMLSIEYVLGDEHREHQKSRIFWGELKVAGDFGPSHIMQ